MKQQVKDIFKKHYFDLGVYRWLSNRPRFVTRYFLSTWIGAILFAVGGFFTLCAISATLFIGLIFVGAIDHILIGLSKTRVQNALDNESIFISWEEACDIAGFKSVD